MASLRRSQIPENLEAFASAITGFSEPIIERACHNIEITVPQGREPAFPVLGTLVSECRAAAQIIRDESNTWSLSRYKDCLMFDRFMADQVKHYNRTTHDICEAYPSMAIAWTAWKNQKAAGTLICPQWCDLCEGNRYLVAIDEAGDRWARRCAACRSASA